jgi:hypothetical protein
VIRGGTKLALVGGERGERLRAGVVAAGVEITVGGQSFPFTRETREVVIRLEPSGPVLTSS